MYMNTGDFGKKNAKRFRLSCSPSTSSSSSSSDMESTFRVNRKESKRRPLFTATKKGDTPKTLPASSVKGRETKIRSLSTSSSSSSNDSDNLFFIDSKERPSYQRRRLITSRSSSSSSSSSSSRLSRKRNVKMKTIRSEKNDIGKSRDIFSMPNSTIAPSLPSTENSQSSLPSISSTSSQQLITPNPYENRSSRFQSQFSPSSPPIIYLTSSSSSSSDDEYESELHNNTRQEVPSTSDNAIRIPSPLPFSNSQPTNNSNTNNTNRSHSTTTTTTTTTIASPDPPNDIDPVTSQVNNNNNNNNRSVTANSSRQLFVNFLSKMIVKENVYAAANDDVQERNVDDNINDNFDSRTTLPSMEKIRDQNITLFLHYFQTTHKLRLSLESSCFELQLMPNVEHFSNYFESKMKEPNSGLVRQMRLASISEHTIKRAGSSALLFLVFTATKKWATFDKLDSDPSSQLFTHHIIQLICTLTFEEKSEMVASFIKWYEELPICRLSPMKLMTVNGQIDRCLIKENSTLHTVARGLLAFLTYVGALEPSSAKRPTEESGKIWHGVAAVLNASKFRKGGVFRKKEYPLSTSDISRLLLKNPKCDTQFELQSMLLSLFLAGTGLRIGSVRSQFSPDKSSGNLASDEDDEDECNDEGECNDEQESIIEGHQTEMPPNDQKELCVRFDCMKVNDVKIWRLPRKQGDHPNSARLRCEINVHSSKTKGLSVFSPEKYGSCYPTITCKNQEDWHPNETIAVTLLAAMAGSLRVNQLFDDEYEPPSDSEFLLTYKLNRQVPLIRAHRDNVLLSTSIRSVQASMRCVADKLNLPSYFYTSKSLRKGFAKGLVEGIVSRTTDDDLISLSGIRDTMYTSLRWNSNQTDHYLRNLTEEMTKKSLSNVRCTSFDWISAVFNSSPWSKHGYSHIGMKDVEKMLTQENNDNNIRTWKNKRSLMDITNAARWEKSANVVVSSIEDMKQMLMDNPHLDLRQTVSNFRRWRTESNKDQQFCGYGSRQSFPPFKCPVVGCVPQQLMMDVDETIIHWKQHHQRDCFELTYRCVSCESAEVSKHRSFRRHLRKRHHHRDVPFRWQFL